MIIEPHDYELGHFALILALCLALLQATLPLFGASRVTPG